MKTQFQSENLFIQILDALEDMVLVKSANSKLLWANKSFCVFYGMSNEQLAGLIDAPHNSPDYTQKYVQDDAWVFANGKTLDIPQEEVVRHDGVVRLFHTVKSPIFNSMGHVELTVGISRDITDQIEKVKFMDAQRTHLVNSAKMATLGEMAGGIAHEINTPLAAIKMMSNQIYEILLEDQIDVNQIKINSERIDLTTDRIAKIIDGLRKFSRDDSQLPFINYSLSKIIEETLLFCRERMVHKGIEFEKKLHGEEIFLECNPVQLSQAFLSVLNNAIDAVSEINSEKKITIETRLTMNEIYIELTDSGNGVDIELRKKIFNPFFTTKDIGLGTGLGLSISRGIIQAHNGEISLDENSKKTKFIIRLPQKS